MLLSKYLLCGHLTIVIIPKNYSFWELRTLLASLMCFKNFLAKLIGTILFVVTGSLVCFFLFFASSSAVFFSANNTLFIAADIAILIAR